MQLSTTMENKLTAVMLPKILVQEGYEKEGNGWSKRIGSIKHWVLLFSNGGYQMYGGEPIQLEDGTNDLLVRYDTGIITQTGTLEFRLMIRTFNENHQA